MHVDIGEEHQQFLNMHVDISLEYFTNDGETVAIDFGNGPENMIKWSREYD